MYEDSRISGLRHQLSTPLWSALPIAGRVIHLFDCIHLASIHPNAAQVRALVGHQPSVVAPLAPRSSVPHVPPSPRLWSRHQPSCPARPFPTRASASGPQSSLVASLAGRAPSSHCLRVSWCMVSRCSPDALTIPAGRVRHASARSRPYSCASREPIASGSRAHRFPARCESCRFDEVLD